jgi:hypothetical protein
LDYDRNGIPDACDLDCNLNGIPDSCDLDCGVGDCASNPQGCGASGDCQPNGIPDECDLGEILINDEFSGTTLAVAYWASVSGATVDDVGIDEPTPPYSLRLHGEDFVGDSVESVTFDLSSAGSVALSFYWQRTGGGSSPSANDDLAVEYRWGPDAWTWLDLYSGQGPDMTRYERRSRELPSGALHDNFALRFRNSANSGGTSDWFVDNVRLWIRDMPDCNDNSVPDECDLAKGTSSDVNSTGIPDECEGLGDADGDGDVDLNDYTVFDKCLFGPEVTPTPSPAPPTSLCLETFDVDTDGDVDLWDFGAFQVVYTGPVVRAR